MQHLMPYTPHQNGVAERKNRALKEMATFMLEDNFFSPNIWDEDINCAAYVHNRVPKNNLKRKLHFRLGVVTCPMFLISGFLAQRLGIKLLLRRERH